MAILFRLGNVLHWTLRLLVAALVVDLLYLASIWPDWAALRKGPVPQTNFMVSYESARVRHHWPRVAWHPVSLSQVPRILVRAVLIGEDSRFYIHHGFDFVAIRDAWDYNWAEGRIVFGASTISQQTVKNLFLSPSRNPLRKWHEAVLTWGLEHHLTKNRILEIYLNTAEFGRGIYGVDAAARAYFGEPVSALTLPQAAELAATLPGPVKNNPRTRSRYFVRRAHKIEQAVLRELSPLPLPVVPVPHELPPEEQRGRGAA